MLRDDGSYFRHRADTHLVKADESAFGTACVHRRFADLYLERAMKADQSGGERLAQAMTWSRLGIRPAAANAPNLPIESGAAARPIPAVPRREQ